ncbi:hypothetical protein V8E53_008320 [Lactarius tabidus]
MRKGSKLSSVKEASFPHHDADVLKVLVQLMTSQTSEVITLYIPPLRHPYPSLTSLSTPIPPPSHQHHSPSLQFPKDKPPALLTAAKHGKVNSTRQCATYSIAILPPTNVPTQFSSGTCNTPATNLLPPRLRHPRSHTVVPSTQGSHPPSVPRQSLTVSVTPPGAATRSLHPKCWRTRATSNSMLIFLYGTHLDHISPPLPSHLRLISYRPLIANRPMPQRLESQCRSPLVLLQNVGGQMARRDRRMKLVGAVCCELVQSLLATALIHLHLARVRIYCRLRNPRPNLDVPSMLCPFSVHRMALRTSGRMLGSGMDEYRRRRDQDQIPGAKPPRCIARHLGRR